MRAAGLAQLAWDPGKRLEKLATWLAGGLLRHASSNRLEGQPEPGNVQEAEHGARP